MTQLPPTAVSPPRPRRSVVKNTFFSGLSKVQGAVIGYLTTLVLLHSMSVENYGLYSLLFAGVINNISMLGRFGIGNVLARFIPEYYSGSQYGVIARLFKASNLIQAAGSTLMTIAAFILAPLIATKVGFPGAASVIRIFAVGTFAYLMTDNFRLVLGGMFQQRAIMMVTLTYNLVRLASLYLVTRFPDPLPKVMLAESALFLFMLIIYFTAYRLRIVPLMEHAAGEETVLPWRRFTRYAGLYYMNEIGVTLIGQATDLFLVSSFLGDLAAGFYGLANRILGFAIAVLPNRIFGDVIEPLFFSEYGNSKPHEARFGFHLFLKVSLLASLPIGIWLSLMGRPLIVELFDSRYAEAAGILTVSGFLMPLIALRMPLGLMLQNAERPDLLLYAKVSGVFKILLGLWLMSKGSIMTMVWITLSMTTLEIIMNFVFVATILHVHADYKGMLKLGINSIISVVLFFPLRFLFQSRIGVIASIPVFAAIFLGINILHKSFHPEERDFINKKLPRPLWKF